MQEDHCELKTNLGFIVRPWLKTKFNIYFLPDSVCQEPDTAQLGPSALSSLRKLKPWSQLRLAWWGFTFLLNFSQAHLL